MTREEILAKRNEAMAGIQQGMALVEKAKASVAIHRGKVQVYEELLAELDKEEGEPEEKPDEKVADIKKKPVKDNPQA